MQENSTYRIRAKVGDTSENVINVKLDQHYDMFEILSLKISQENFYKTYESGYGVIVGRVIANGGFGVPNAKVSVFIESDGNGDIESRIYYPYKSPNGKNADGVRYNLLTDFLDKVCYQNVGTFPNKRLVLDNDDVIDVFDKYYRYTTVTNNAGDYMIFGVPTGSQRLHVDVDLSDIGMLSQRPRDMIYKGYDINLFESPNKFRQDNNLNSLAQILTQDIGVYVYPYWGDTSENADNIAVTRADIQLDYKFEPTCVFMGSIITDTGSNAIGKNCTSTESVGKMSELIAGEGSIEMIRKTYDGKVEEFQVKGNRVIDGDGVWCYQIPMNLDYIMTDEFGNIAPSDNPEKGIPTRTRVRFRISLDDAPDDNTARKRCKYLVPNNPRLDEDLFPKFTNTKEPDYEFGTMTRDESYKDLLWNKVYTVKNYVPRLQKNRRVTDRKHTGIKLINHYEGNNPMPYNNVDIKLGFTYRLLCVIFKIFINLVQFLNQILTALSLSFCAIYSVFNRIANLIRKIPLVGGKLSWPFRQMANLFKALIVPCVGISSDMCGGNTTHNNTFYPGCGNLMFSGKSAGGLASCIKDKTRESHNKKEDKKIKNGEIDASERTVALLGGTEELYNCVETALAEDNDTISLNFQNDWINGTLYAPMWFRKITKKRSYLFGLIKRSAKDQWCEGEKNYTRKILRVFAPCAPKRPGKYTYSNFDNKNVTAHYMNYSDNKRYADSCRDKCHEATKAINLDKGLIVKRQTMLGQDVYYYKPVEYGRPQDSLLKSDGDFAVDEDGNGGSVKILFATDIVLLGSLNDCDIHGVPQFFKSLESTTFQIPPNILFTDNEITVTMSKGSTNSSTDDDPDNVKVEYDVTEESASEMTGMDWGNFNEDICGKWSDPQDSGLFYSIGCSTIKMKPKSCINMSRICEFGVSLDETKSFIKKGISVSGEESPIDELLYGTIIPDGFISKDELYNDDERSLFATLNINGLHTDRNMENGLMEYTFKHVVVDNFDKSLYAYMVERQSKCALSQRYNYYLEEFSKGYYDFRMGKKPYFYDTDFRLPRYENSFYFFFGLNPGKTAIDKFNSQFTSDCDNANTQLDPIDIEAVGNSWCSEMWGDGDGYVTFNLSYVDLPCDIVISCVSNASFGDVSFQDNEDEMFYVSHNRHAELEELGYVRKEISVPYDVNNDGTIGPNEAIDYFLNGVYDVVVTDNNGEIITTTMTMKADPMKSYVVGTDFTEAENVLLKDLGSDCNIAKNKQCLPSSNNLTINSTRGIGGTIAVSAPYNGRTGDLISSFKIEVAMVGGDSDFAYMLTYCEDDIVNQGANTTDCEHITLLRYNSDIFVFGVPKGDQTYRVTITELCCSGGCGDNDCDDSNNVYIEDVRIRNVENFKLFVNGTVDYDVIKHWKCGFTVNANGDNAPRVNVSSTDISPNWWHMSNEDNYLWFNLDAYNDIDKRLVQLVKFYENALAVIDDNGYMDLYNSVRESNYEAKREMTLRLNSFLRKSDITISNSNDNEYTWSPVANRDWEDNIRLYSEETGYIVQENKNMSDILGTDNFGLTYVSIFTHEEISWSEYNALSNTEKGHYIDSTTYTAYQQMVDGNYINDGNMSAFLSNPMCYVKDNCWNIVSLSEPDKSDCEWMPVLDVVSCRKTQNGDYDIEETIYSLFTTIISINEEIIELLNEVFALKNEFINETKRAFQLSCSDEEKSIFFTTQTKNKPVVYHAVYKPETLEYDETDTSYYTLECDYVYTDDGENVEMITIPTISYKNSDAFSPLEPDSCPVNNGLDSELCYAVDNLSSCSSRCNNHLQAIRKYCYFIAVRNRMGRRIPNDTKPTENSGCPDSIPENVKLTENYFGYHIVDKIFNKAIMAWSVVDNVPYFKPVKDGDVYIDEDKAGVSMCMNGLLTGKIYNGNVTEDIQLESPCNNMLDTNFAVQTFGDYTMDIYTGINAGETIDVVEDKMPTRRYIVGSTINSGVDNNSYDNYRVTNGQNGQDHQENADHANLWTNCEKRQQYVPVLKTGMTFVIEDENYCQLLETIDGRMKITLEDSSVNLSSVKLKNRRKGCKLNVKLQNTGDADKWLFLVFSANNAQGDAVEYPLNLTEKAYVYYTKDVSTEDFVDIYDSGTFEPGEYFFTDDYDEEVMITDATVGEIGNNQVYRKISAEVYNSLSPTDQNGFIEVGDTEGACRRVKFDCMMGGDDKKLYYDSDSQTTIPRNLFSYYNDINGYKRILDPFSKIVGLGQSFGGKPTVSELSSKYVIEETEEEYNTRGFGSTGEFTFNKINGFNDSYYIVAVTDNNIRAISPVYDFPYVCARLIFGIVYSKKETLDENGFVNGYEYDESYKATFDIANVVIVKNKCDDDPITIPSRVKPDEVLYYFFYYPYDISFECKLDDTNTITGSYRHTAYKDNPFGYEMFNLDKSAYDSLYSIYKGSHQKVGSKIRSNTTIMAKDYVGLNHNVDWYGCNNSTASKYGCGHPYEFNTWVEVIWVTNGGKWVSDENCNHYVDIECGCDENNDECMYNTESNYVRVFKKGETYNPFDVGKLENPDCDPSEPNGGFLGWSKSYDSIDYADNANITINGEATESMIYYAVWSCDMVTVKWIDCDDNGNTLLDEEENVLKGTVFSAEEMNGKYPYDERNKLGGWTVVNQDDAKYVSGSGWIIKSGTFNEETGKYEVVFKAMCVQKCSAFLRFLNYVNIYEMMDVVVNILFTFEIKYPDGTTEVTSVNGFAPCDVGLYGPNGPGSNVCTYKFRNRNGVDAFESGTEITVRVDSITMEDSDGDNFLDGEGITGRFMNGRNTIKIGGDVEDGSCRNEVMTFVTSPDGLDCSQTFNVTWMWGYEGAPNNGVIKIDHNVCRGSQFVVPTNVSRSGYTLIGWLEDGVYEVDFSMTVQKSMTIVAQWQSNEANVTVRFMSDENTEIPSFRQTVAPGTALVVGDFPTDSDFTIPEGKSFDGKWEVRPESTRTRHVVDTNDFPQNGVVVNVSTDFIAVLTDINSYSFSFYVDETELDDFTRTVYEGTTLSSEDVPEDYIVEGMLDTCDAWDGMKWVRETEVNGSFVADGEYTRNNIVGLEISSNTRFVAKLSTKQVTITFYWNLPNSNTEDAVTVTIDCGSDGVVAPTNAPSVSGYAFNGWTLNEVPISDEAIYAMIFNSNAEFYASWGHYVTFYRNLQNLDSQTNWLARLTTDPVTHKIDSASVPSPTQSGYQFLGWCTRDGNERYQNSYFNTAVFNSNMDYYAKFQQIMYEVWFEWNLPPEVDGKDIDGNTIDPTTVIYEVAPEHSLTDDGYLSPPTPPTLNGFEFDTWISSDSGQPISEEDIMSMSVDSSPTVYSARWAELAPITVYFKVVDKTVEDGFVRDLDDYTLYDFPYNSRLLSNQIPTEQVILSVADNGDNGKYHFNSWSPEIDSLITTTTTFRADCGINQYMATFRWYTGYDLNFGTTVRHGYKVPTNSIPPHSQYEMIERPGYTFIEWSPNPYTTEIRSNTNFIGVWEETTSEMANVTIKIEDKNNSTVNWIYSQFSVEKGTELPSEKVPDSQAVEQATGEADKYEFDSWKDFNNGETPVGATITDDITFTAYVTVRKYSVTFIDGDNTSTASQDYGYQFTMESRTRTKLNFMGWLCSADDVTYTTGSSYTVRGNVTFYAKWEAVTTFRAKDSNTNQTISELTDLAKHGVVLLGNVSSPYTLTEDDIPSMDAVMGVIGTNWEFNTSLPPNYCAWVGLTISQNTTLDIYVEEKPFTVTFIYGNGQSDVVEDVYRGNTFTTPVEDPTYDGYFFRGWLCDVDGIVYDGNTLFENISQDMTFTAQWVLKHTVTFVFNKGGIPNEIRYVGHGERLLQNQIPTSDDVNGYHFDGWYGDTSQPIMDDTTFNARWTIIVQFKANGNVIDTQYLVNNGSDHVKYVPTVQVESGKIFKDLWTIEGSSTQYSEAQVLAMQIQSPTTFVAVIVNTYSATFHFNQDGMDNVVVMVEQGQQVPSGDIPIPGDVGDCTFLGWTPDPYLETTVVNYPMDFYAQWDCSGEEEFVSYAMNWEVRNYTDSSIHGITFELKTFHPGQSSLDKICQTKISTGGDIAVYNAANTPPYGYRNGNIVEIQGLDECSYLEAVSAKINYSKGGVEGVCTITRNNDNDFGYIDPRYGRYTYSCLGIDGTPPSSCSDALMLINLLPPSGMPTTE